MLYLQRLEWPRIVMPQCQCHRKPHTQADFLFLLLLTVKAVAPVLGGWVVLGVKEDKPLIHYVGLWCGDRHGEEGGADHGEEAASLQGDHLAQGSARQVFHARGGAGQVEAKEGACSDLDDTGAEEAQPWGTFTCSDRCGDEPGSSALLEPVPCQLKQRIPSAGSQRGEADPSTFSTTNRPQFPSLGHLLGHI